MKPHQSYIEKLAGYTIVAGDGLVELEGEGGDHLLIPCDQVGAIASALRRAGQHARAAERFGAADEGDDADLAILDLTGD